MLDKNIQDVRITIKLKESLRPKMLKCLSILAIQERKGTTPAQ